MNPDLGTVQEAQKPRTSHAVNVFTGTDPLLNIREATKEDFGQIWPIFHLLFLLSRPPVILPPLFSAHNRAMLRRFPEGMACAKNGLP